MHENPFAVILPPVLGWLTATSLVIVAYLCRLEIAEWRRHRRLEQKRARLSLQSPYRPTSERGLAFQRGARKIDLSNRPGFPRVFRHTDRPGWDLGRPGLN